jgi:hypothetical protein
MLYQNDFFFPHHLRTRLGVLVCMKNVCGFGQVRVVGEFMVCARECACDLTWQGLVCATCRFGVGSFSGCPLAGCNGQACLLQQTSGPRKCGKSFKAWQREFKPASMSIDATPAFAAALKHHSHCLTHCTSNLFTSKPCHRPHTYKWRKEYKCA